MATKEKRLYLVGYVGDREPVFGKKGKGEDFNWARPMTAHDAKTALKELSPSFLKTIYKIVPVKLK